MGNSLLDFVMALVRDPDVSARYAADPAGVLADAHLPGVTIADVNNLIPVVTDSLAASTPGFGAVADSGNVWASSAATAAFDAFDISPPRDQQHQPAVTLPETHPDQPVRAYPDYQAVQADAAPVPAHDQMTVPPTPEPVAPDWADDSGWHHPPVDPEHHPGDHPGFDLF